MSASRSERFTFPFWFSLSFSRLSSLQDLHRTGCELFSGQDAEQNQALLKQVLLAYARWNTSVGYCQVRRLPPVISQRRLTLLTAGVQHLGCRYPRGR